jgi:hypothetical protein
MIQIVGGIAAGAAAMMLAPSLMSAIAPVVKPVIKTFIKGGLLAFETGKTAVHELEAAVASSVEAIEDLTAEAKAEIAEGQKMSVKTSKKKAAAVA